MQNRAIFVSALALIVPVLLVLIGIVALARPSSATLPAASPGDALPAKLVPTSVSAAQPAAHLPASAAPTAVPAPKPRPSGPAAPGFDGGAWVNSEPLELAKLGMQGKVVLV